MMYWKETDDRKIEFECKKVERWRNSNMERF